MSLDRAFDLAEVNQVAFELLKQFPDARKFAFSGDVGAGKTTLIKALAIQLGYTGDVDSPTFSIVNEYRQSSIHIVHIDLYRLSSDELESVGLDVYFEDDDAYIFVEWPEKIPELISEDFVIVRLGVSGEGRKIQAIALTQTD